MPKKDTSFDDVKARRREERKAERATQGASRGAAMRAWQAKVMDAALAQENKTVLDAMRARFEPVLRDDGTVAEVEMALEAPPYEVVVTPATSESEDGAMTFLTWSVRLTMMRGTVATRHGIKAGKLLDTVADMVLEAEEAL